VCLEKKQFKRRCCDDARVI